MIHDSQILCAVLVWLWSREDAQRWEREDTGCLPFYNCRFNLWRPHQVGFVGGRTISIMRGHVVIRAADLVLGTVPTRKMSQYACFKHMFS